MNFEGEFSTWKCRMEVFFNIDFDLMLIMKNSFEILKDRWRRIKGTRMDQELEVLDK